MDRERVKAIFDEALAREGEEREAALDRLCGDNTALRNEVEELIAAFERAGRFLEPSQANIDEGPGSVVGRYKLLQQIGEGGFGVVYMAEQTKPVKRKVALKIVKLGMDTRQVIARFEAERQALALMDHPNIAKVLDAGETAAGRPYFVMALVKGVPITEYCDQARLDTQDRLELVQRVCYAVQHAHQKGIIHRDLKPNNVLVTLHDGRPVPKVIDFGIAKATDRTLTEKTLFTEFQQIVGTPEYMAPEQAEMSGLDIDTRADIYSLGVLTYELLTGSKPFDLKTLLQQGYDEVLRTIREVDPPRPSTRLSTQGEALDAIAQRRQVAPTLLSRLVRGDLDWIVMRALEKDRTRRYETAAGLARDIQRFLDHEPVRAGPPGTRYRVAKYLRRNRVAVTVAATVVGGVLLSAGLALAGMRAANRQAELEEVAQADATAKTRAARSAMADERSQRERAERGVQAATTEIGRTAAAMEFITDVLRSADPHRRNGANYTVRQLLGEFERDLDRRLQDQPAVEASIRAMIGVGYTNLGLFDEAATHLRRAHALRPDSEDSAAYADQSHNLPALLGLCLLKQGKHAEAEPVLRECLAMRAKQMPGHWLHYNAMSLLGGALTGQGKYAEAEPLLVEAYKNLKGPAVADQRRREARERVVKLYEAWGKPDKAKQWRARR